MFGTRRQGLCVDGLDDHRAVERGTGGAVGQGFSGQRAGDHHRIGRHFAERFGEKPEMKSLLNGRDERVDACLELIRTKLSPLPSGERRATLFVVPVERFEQV